MEAGFRTPFLGVKSQQVYDMLVVENARNQMIHRGSMMTLTRHLQFLCSNVFYKLPGRLTWGVWTSQRFARFIVRTTLFPSETSLIVGLTGTPKTAAPIWKPNKISPLRMVTP